MLDFDLAQLYEVETRALNQAINRNLENFPEDFMFKLTKQEWLGMSSQIVMTYPVKRPLTHPPYAFTEHGVTMLASILKSPIARKMNIEVVRSFIQLRKYSIQFADLMQQISDMSEKIGLHDIQLSQIYDAIENLLDEKANNQHWQDRERIGFKHAKTN